MTSVIRPPLQSPYNASITSLGPTHSPLLSSSSSLGTVRHHHQRGISPAGSLVSASSIQRPVTRANQENEAPRPRPQEPFGDSQEKLAVVSLKGHASGNIPRKVSHVSRKSSWGNNIPPPPAAPKGVDVLEKESRELQEVDLSTRDKTTTTTEVDKSILPPPEEQIPTLTIEALVEGSILEVQNDARRSSETQSSSKAKQGFQKWVNNFRRKSLKRSRTVPTRRRDTYKDSTEQKPPSLQPTHKKSSSLNSMAFVKTMKTASMSLASLSLPPPSRMPGRSSRFRSGTRSSRRSGTEARSSMDSRATGPVPLLNGGVWDRAVKRRNIIDELITSEESYISDLKVLVNVYFTLLTSVSTLSHNIRASIKQNVMDIIQLHETLLSEMVALVPKFEERPRQPNRRTRLKPRVRSHSFDLVSTRSRASSSDRMAKLRKSMDNVHPAAEHGGSFTAEPKVAMEVAKVFDRLMSRFFAYEEYGAKYQDLVQETAAAHSSIPAWRHYEKGIEALANSLASHNTKTTQSRKGLHFGDLLIKPIQRVCKYPLLFEDLFKETPVYDCPESHAELEKVLYRLRETVREINKATNDPITRNRIERTWLLQDRLIFPDEVDTMDDQLIRSTMRYRLLAQPQLSQANTIRHLGHVLLCGVLHVTWQSPELVQGQYLLGILFKSVLLVASSSRVDQKYHILAGIRLSDARIESTTNGRGLQCFNALYSWKLVFEVDNRLYEMIFSACSATEETEWKSRIQDRCRAETSINLDRNNGSPSIFPVLVMNMKPMASLSGQPGSVARSISVHQATAESSFAESNQVVIRNTHALKEGQDFSKSGSPSLNRSQSLLFTNRIPIVAPRRSERVRLEAFTASVWSRDLLPYPGMSVRRGEHLIRASANSVMRKLSMASLAKRSTSSASLYQQSKKAEVQANESPKGKGRASGNPPERGRAYSSLRRRGDRVMLSMTNLPGPLPERRSSAAFSVSSKQENIIAQQPSKSMEGLPLYNAPAVETRSIVTSEVFKKRWSSPANLVRGWVHRAFPEMTKTN